MKCKRCGQPLDRDANGRVMPCNCKERLLVQAQQCRTCIYRPDSTLDIRQLEAQIADRRMPGFFRRARACHHASMYVCCRGFWNQHKDHFTVGQLAQRLGLVTFITVDELHS